MATLEKLRLAKILNDSLQLRNESSIFPTSKQILNGFFYSVISLFTIKSIENCLSLFTFHCHLQMNWSNKSTDEHNTERKKSSHIESVESMAELKLDSGFRVIGEHLSQIFSN